jgi:hypothetical protein
MTKYLRRAAVAALLLALAGCGGRGPVNQVSGKVTYKSNPVTGGRVFFHPQGGGTPLPATISPEGTYSAELPPGQMQVTVETESIKGQARQQFDYSKMPVPAGAQAPTPGPAKPVYVKVPAKYGDVKTSPLRVEVKKGKQTEDINLD